MCLFGVECVWFCVPALVCVCVCMCVSGYAYFLALNAIRAETLRAYQKNYTPPAPPPKKAKVS